MSFKMMMTIMTCLRTLNFLNKNHQILKLTVSHGILCLIKGSLEKRQKFPENKFLLFLFVILLRNWPLSWLFWKTISIEQTCSTEHSKPKGWRQRKVQILSPSKLIGPRMLVSIRHKRKNLPIITLVKYLSIVFIYGHHKANIRSHRS